MTACYMCGNQHGFLRLTDEVQPDELPCSRCPLKARRLTASAPLPSAADRWRESIKISGSIMCMNFGAMLMTLAQGFEPWRLGLAALNLGCIYLLWRRIKEARTRITFETDLLREGTHATNARTA